MSPFTTFVSRKLAAAVAAFGLVAAGLVGYAAARDGGGSSGSPEVSAQLVDPAALQAALEDPATIDTSAAEDPTGRSRLRSDLRAAFKLDGDARREALAAIRQKAQDGAYGEAVQRRAERRQIRHDLFFSLLPDNLQADLTRLKDAPADQREQLRGDIMDKALAGGYGPDVQKAAQKLRDLHRR
jgi:hypothetical protein